MTAKKPTKNDRKSSKYKDGRKQGVSAASGTGQTIKDRKNPLYGTEARQAAEAAFRAAKNLKSEKRQAWKVTLAKKGK